MTTPTHTFRRLALVGAVFVAAGLAAPRATADPPTVPLPISASSTPRLGEQLSGRDRSWLTSNSQGKALDLGAFDPLIADAIRASQGTAQPLGEHLSGQDRSWLASGPSQPPAQAGHGFSWGDAGIGAGSALAVVLIAMVGTLLIRGRAHARPSRHALGR
jgi:hypothetical protein